MESTLGYLERELLLPEGGLASAQDADTEGHEGLTFVWTPEQVAAVLPDPADRALAATRWGITDWGNFEGATVLSVVASVEEAAEAAGVDPADAPARLEAVRAALLAAREQRPQPARDDKALAAWNGMALQAFADAGRVLGRPDLVERARGIAEFLLGPLSSADGRLRRAWRDGRTRDVAFADDYGAVIGGLLRAAGGDRRAALAARGRAARRAGRRALPRRVRRRLLPRAGRRRGARRPHEERRGHADAVAQRPAWRARCSRSRASTATPSASASAPPACASCATSRPGCPTPSAARWPCSTPTSRRRRSSPSSARPAPARDALVAEASRHVLPHAVLVVADPAEPGFDDVPLLQGKTAVGGAPAAYVCERFACRQPVTSAEELAALLGG